MMNRNGSKEAHLLIEQKTCSPLVRGKISFLFFFALPLAFASRAHAADECGVDTPGQTLLTCTAPSYPTGIVYTNSSGLQLNLDSPTATVSGSGVSVTSSGTDTDGIGVTADSFSSIQTTATNRPAIDLTNAGGGSVSITVDGGSISTTGSSAPGVRGQISSTSSGADIEITQSSGAIATSGTGSHGIYAFNTGLGLVRIEKSGGSISTSGSGAFGAYAQISNVLNNAAAAVNMSGGSVTIARNSAIGLLSVTNGTGQASTIIDQGTISLTGSSVIGVQSNVNASGATASSFTQMNGGTIEINGANGLGLRSLNQGSGISESTLTDGNVILNGANNNGVVASATGTGNAKATIEGGSIVMGNGGGANASTSSGGAEMIMSGGSIQSTTVIDAAFTAIAARSSASTQATTSTMSGGSIVRTGGGTAVFARNANTTNTADVFASMTGGSLSFSGGPSMRGISAWNQGNGSVTVLMSGGSIFSSNQNSVGVWAQNNTSTTFGSALTRMNGGTIDLTGNGSIGGQSSINGYGSASVEFLDGNITTSGNESVGFAARIFQELSTNFLSMHVGGGQISSSGNNSDGVLVLNSGAGDNSIRIEGGTVVGGSGWGAAVRVDGRSSNDVFLGPNAVVNGAASGIAIRDGDTLTDADNNGRRDDDNDGNGFLDIAAGGNNTSTALPFSTMDGIDETYSLGITAVESQSVVTGNAILGYGQDSFILSGGTWDGSVYLDNPTANTLWDGNDTFSWSAGTLTGDVFGSDGSDVFDVSAASFDGTQTLDGGDDTSIADGMTDVLSLNGVSAALKGNRIRNFERINITGGSVSVSDTIISTGTGPSAGLYVSPGTDVRMFGKVTIDGDLANAGSVNMQNGLAGDELTVTGTYQGGGVIRLDLSPRSGRSDKLFVEGGFSGAKTSVDVNALDAARSPARTQIISSSVANIADYLDLAAPIENDAIAFGFQIEDGDVYLTSQYGHMTPIYEQYLPTLLSASNLPSLSQRLGARFGAERSNSIMSQGDGEGTFEADPMTIDANPVWTYLSGGRSTISQSNSTTGSELETSWWRTDVAAGGELMDLPNGEIDVSLGAFYGKLQTQASYSGAASLMSTDMFGMRLTATVFQDDGLYFDGQLQGAILLSDLFSGNYGALVQNNLGWTLSGGMEVGQKISLTDTASLTTSASVQYASGGFRKFTGRFGDTILSDNPGEISFVLGSQFENTHEWITDMGEFHRWKAYGFANLRRVEAGNVSTLVGNVQFESGQTHWSGEIGLGGNIGRSDDAFSLFGEVSIRNGISNRTTQTDITGRVGFTAMF